MFLVFPSVIFKSMSWLIYSLGVSVSPSASHHFCLMIDFVELLYPGQSSGLLWLSVKGLSVVCGCNVCTCQQICTSVSVSSLIRGERPLSSKSNRCKLKGQFFHGLATNLGQVVSWGPRIRSWKINIGLYPRERNTCVHIKTCTRMFIAAFFIIANETHIPSTGEWINKIHTVEYDLGTSLAAQWLRLHTSNAEVMGSMPDWGTKISHATWRGQKNKRIYDLIIKEMKHRHMLQHGWP